MEQVQHTQTKLAAADGAAGTTGQELYLWRENARHITEKDAETTAKKVRERAGDQQMGKYGERWVQAYSDASVYRGDKASEDTCGVGVWVASLEENGGRSTEMMPEGESAAVHLAWRGLERVDSTIGELFGVIEAVLIASGANLPTGELTVVINLDNKGVVDHFNRTRNEQRARRQLTQHARALWNALHCILGKLKIRLVLVWQRARHNQLMTEGCEDGDANELVDKGARRGRDPQDGDGIIDWQGLGGVAHDMNGEPNEEAEWSLAEREVAVYLPNTNGELRPVT